MCKGVRLGFVFLYVPSLFGKAQCLPSSAVVRCIGILHLFRARALGLQRNAAVVHSFLQRLVINL